MAKTCILYGAPCSLYTGKARAYLIKQGIGFREVTPAAQRFTNEVVPAVHRWRLPVVELPGPAYIQDSTVIIDHFEKQPEMVSRLPETPRQKIIALLIDLLGAEGMLRPAMHYRWNFKEENEGFLEQNFRTLVPANGGDVAAMTREAMNSMRQAAVSFGVVPAAFSVIEKVYEEFLDLLDKHFSRHPYLLGGKPSTGDFGLIAPFFAHLARDPYPSSMMKKRACHVFRWTERMNRADSDMGEFPDYPAAFLDADQIPDTLKAALKFIAEADLVAETAAAAECINQWLGENQPPAGARVKRGVGYGLFEIQGVPVKALAQPYRFFLLKRMQNAYADLDEPGQQAVQSLLAELGMESLLSITIDREVVRSDNLEVWQ